MRKADGFESERMFIVPPSMTSDVAGHPLLRRLRVTDIGYFPKALYHYRERPEGCDTHIFIYSSDGEGTVRIGEDRFQLKERMLAMVPAHTPHMYQAHDTNPWSIYWFHLQGEEAALFARSLQLDASPIRIGASESAKLIELFHHIFDLLSANPYSPDHWVHASQAVKYLLSYLGVMRGRTANGESRSSIERAVAYMRERLESNVSLDELAGIARVSKQHLHHLFKQATGYPPIDYFLRLKMQRAAHLLDWTDRSVKDISLTLGFKDPYYFSRLFKKIMGLPPTDYRNKTKG